ncbi:hypothetical protein HELRODRAFT_160072 [Helobdella robusta]|uniref:ADF-H domain-containing protein n=1 Tax=Helobdella robusta TaxID=6412 RepID=T1EPQ9_HELRO|nr:hypothetical protein HELRODRAFT_160072 [Helobdella robusta]ESO05970.1 hypothetical protein HELRODRAFT_160072 [Helobdella robusta]
MASGVQVSDECKTVFQDVKMGHKYRYVIFCISSDLKMIQVQKKAEPGAEYEDFLADMTEAEDLCECRYAIFDFEYLTKDNQSRNKLIFFMWSPEKAKIKQKMVYASSRDALKKALGEGIAKEVQANDHGDLKWESIMEIISRTERT